MKQSTKKTNDKVAPRSPKANLRSRGMAMGTTMFVLMIMITVALIGIVGKNGDRQGGLARHVNEGQIFGKRRSQEYVAHALAEDGVRMAMQWLNQSRQPPQNDTAFGPSETTQISCSNFLGSTAVTNHWNTVTVTNPDGSTNLIKVRLYPFKVNSISGRKQYIIESVGIVNDIKQIVRATALQQTFAKYAFFADKILLNPGGQYAISFTSEANAFKGPVHINGMLPDGSAVSSTAAINIRWQPSTGSKPQSTTQIFRYNGTTSFTTSMSSSQIKWQDMNGAAAPVGSTSWGDIIASGAAPKTGVAVVRMPVSTTTQKDAATNGDTPVHLGSTELWAEGMNSDGPLKNGGIYVTGDVSNVLLKATGTNNTTQVIQILQIWDIISGILRPIGYVPPTGVSAIERRETITIDRVANTTTIVKETRLNIGGVIQGTSIANPTGWATAETLAYTGTSNGVIYFAGNIGDTTTKIGGISGAIANNVMSGSTISKANALMIVTDQTKTTQINGGIIFANTQDTTKGGGTVSSPTGNLVSSATDPVMASGTTDVSVSGLLGLVTNNVLITKTDVGGGIFSYTSGASTYIDLSIHAIVMAYNTISADAWDSRPPGNCRLIGGFISAGALPMGQVSTQSVGGVTTVTVSTGFNVSRNYDSRGASTPPPFFPTPAGASFLMTAMQDAVTPLDGALP